MISGRLFKRTTPKWMASFTYLLILMMSFLILLLSFSQLDIIKYKKMVVSLQSILGVTVNHYNKDTLTLNSSIVLQEYSTGNTPVIVKTVNDNKSIFQDLIQVQAGGNAVNDLGANISQELTPEIKSGIIELQTGLNTVIIRLNEKYSFESGSANIKNDSYPVLYKISNIIAQTPGFVTVTGFTDDVPVQNSDFHDNWELSAMRAYKVLIALLESGNSPERFTLIANGSNYPLYPNNSIASRSKNRRVEITLIQPKENIINNKKDIQTINQLNNSQAMPKDPDVSEVDELNQ